MSKIELTKEQVQRLRGSWSMPGTYHEALEKVANELVAMGLVRPASDPHAAHFKELWESIDGRIKAHDDLAARVAAVEAKYETLATATLDPSDVDETPDPHAAAKERAKLWGVELVRVNQGEGGDLSFASKTQYWNMASWLPLGTTPVEKMYGFYKTTPEAWSNFPTEPPPGWEAPKDNGFGDNDSWTGPAEPKPRTEADRLGEVAYNEYWADDEVCSWEECHDDTRGQWSTIALAVRKADRASQLEPSEEEHKAANMAYLECSSANVDTAVKAALIAAARVRLEKAEGEQ